LNALYSGSVAQSTQNSQKVGTTHNPSASVFESHRPDGVSVETYTPG
jgi:hypothetical protein